MNNKTLFLPLKAKWYELIEKGIKKEEYREIKPYWIKRLMIRKFKNSIIEKAYLKNFDKIRFSYGYTKRTMYVKCNGLKIGRGNPDWGAPEKEVFIIKLGRIIK